ncbi:MAG: GNAT family N-acetyltransferase [Myxococcales bacterium]|nr:GNAT family N-acetyltransferase [Myxococcales bacterium]
MTDTTTIERARPDDAPRLTELFLADMRDLGLTPDVAAMRSTAARLVGDDHSHVWVARNSDGVAVAVVVATEFISIKFPGRALWIEELYVDPGSRRGGLGRQLVEALLVWAHEAGYAGVELEAYRMNTAASVLYRSLGFRRLARERYAFDMTDFELEDDA